MTKKQQVLRGKDLVEAGIYVSVRGGKGEGKNTRKSGPKIGRPMIRFNADFMSSLGFNAGNKFYCTYRASKDGACYDCLEFERLDTDKPRRIGVEAHIVKLLVRTKNLVWFDVQQQPRFEGLEQTIPKEVIIDGNKIIVVLPDGMIPLNASDETKALWRKRVLEDA